MTPATEHAVEHAALLRYGKDGEAPPAQLLAEADKAINGLQSISGRYSPHPGQEVP